ncbi:MAG: hypothetical protein WC714_28870 [Candidatus Obscuribacterales bacterium]|jgi:hypothetical protein
MKIKLGGIYYTVCKVLDLHDGEQKLDGQLKHSEASIYLDSVLCPQAEIQTTLHEIVHVITAQNGRQDMGEDAVDAMAFGLMGFLRDNPRLVKRWMDILAVK